MTKLRHMLLALTLALTGVALGCKGKEPARSPATKVQEAPVKGASGARSEFACQTIQRDFRALLKVAKGSCEKDADCSCYPPIVDCGGATDRLSWGRLRTLVRMFHLARCKPPAGCVTGAPCKPQCVGGRCQASAQALR